MRILVSAGEASGDRYAAGVVSALRRALPDASYFGCGGPRMREAGVEAVVRTEDLSVVGLFEVLRHIPRIHGLYRKLVDAAARLRPDLAILTDAPDFHLRLASRLRDMGVPVAYYVAPQVWAWRRRRIGQIRRLVDHLLVIFPFEEEFFRQRGVEASFESDVRPVGDWIKNWVEAGVEIPSLALEQAQRRGIESFYQLAMNGYDVGWDGTRVVPMTIPMKAAHPEWLMWPYGHVESGYMNYAEPGVRDFVTEIVREVAWRFDHDGINLDFARLDVLLPQGQQWELREHLNDLMRTLRAVLLERERVRGRPYLLSVQIPPDVVSCHATGIDIETWVREGLVDLLILGCRTFDVDVRDFRRLTAGYPVKLFPCIDAHHSSDGYFHPSLELQRGAAGLHRPRNGGKKG